MNKMLDLLDHPLAHYLSFLVEIEENKKTYLCFPLLQIRYFVFKGLSVQC